MTRRTKPKVYIAGPMRGVPYYNFPLFDATCEKLKEQGYRVFSPADMDRKRGFDALLLPADYAWHEYPDSDFCIKETLSQCMQSIALCDAIYLLPGWNKSSGARVEYHFARVLGLQVIDGAIHGNDK